MFGELVGEITSVFQPGHASRDLAWYLDALWRRDRVIAAWDQFFEAVDALIIPAAIRSAIPHCETGAPIDVAGKPVNYWEMPACLTPINLAGLPALVVPAGTDADGLPIAIQIVGSRWSEMRLLDIARALEYEGILPGFRPPPLS